MSASTEYCLREMTEEDIPSVLAIEKHAQFHPWSKAEFERSLSANRRAWVIETTPAKQLSAFAVFGLLAGEVELLTIATHTDHQRKGFAKALIQHAIENLAAETIFLEVRESNTNAIELYESIGFNEIGCRKNYYPATNGQRENALLYALTCA